MHKKKKLLVLLGLFLASILIAIYFISSNKINYNKKLNTTKKINVVTTLFPLYDIAKNIGGEAANVSLLLSPGVEPHSFEPTPKDISRITDADIFIYTGKFMEPWAQDILNSIDNKDLIVVNASTGVNIELSDPHIWLDFDNMILMSKNIRKAFTQKDDRKDFYKHEQNYINDLIWLNNTYQKSLDNCSARDIFYGGHYAFAYLAKKYNLNYVAAQGLSPDAEPSAKDLVSLIDQIKSTDAQFLFYEELSSPKISETLSKETNTELLLLNAAPNITKEDRDHNISFKDIMISNLDNLKIGLNCK